MNIKLTVEVDGNALSRNYIISEDTEANWNLAVEGILDTLSKSNDAKF